MVGAEAICGWLIELIGLPIPAVGMGDHEGGRPPEAGPEHQELQCRQRRRMGLCHREGPLLGLHIGEIIEPLQVVAQQGNREGLAERLPAVLLRLLHRGRRPPPPQAPGAWR